MSFNAKIIKLKRLLLNKQNMKRLASEAAKLVRVRTSLGFGVAKDNGDRFKLAPLKDSTIDYREDMADRGDLSANTRVTRSNLTAYGDMLGSIDGKGVSAGKGQVYLKGSNRHGEKNEKIASYHHVRTAHREARPFMHLSKAERNQLKRKVKAQFLLLFKKL